MEKEIEELKSQKSEGFLGTPKTQEFLRQEIKKIKQELEKIKQAIKNHRHDGHGFTISDL